VLDLFAPDHETAVSRLRAFVDPPIVRPTVHAPADIAAAFSVT